MDGCYQKHLNARLVDKNVICMNSALNMTKLSQPSVVIVIPAYNAGSFLKEAIESSLRQSYTECRLIVINDCSTDGTKQLLGEYVNDSRVTIVENLENKGKSESLNEVLPTIEEKYVALMDADDVMYPHRIEKQVRYMEKNPNIGASSGFMEYISSDGRVKDGAHFGSPQRLVFRNNSVLRMGVEAVYSTNGNQLLGSSKSDFIMPTVGGNDSVSIEISGTAAQHLTAGDIINIRIPLVPGANTGNNLMLVVSVDLEADLVTIENTGSQGNSAAGTVITAGKIIYLEVDDPNEAEITDNYLNGTLPPGGRGFDLTSGIVTNARSVIKRNYVRGFAIGINIYKETRTTLFPGARGSIVKNNIIFSRDTVQHPGVFGRGIQLWSNEERAVDNYIITPVSTRFTGVVSRGKDALIRNNYVTTQTIYNTGFSSSNRSVGIAVGNESHGTLMDSNYTFGMDVGAGPENYHRIIIHYVRDHHSYQDINARDVYGSRPYPE